MKIPVAFENHKKKNGSIGFETLPFARNAKSSGSFSPRLSHLNIGI
jgi:hypothetical protein